MPSIAAFTTDDFNDRIYASNKRSRFEAYLTAYRFLDMDEQPTGSALEFAAAAFSTAQSPIMAPGYVSRHPRILQVCSTMDDYERLAIAVTLALPLSQQIIRKLGSQWRSWHRTGFGDQRGWEEPEGNHRLTALPTLMLRVPVTEELLPAPKYQRDGSPVIATAKQAVHAVCDELNRVLAPVLTELDPQPQR